MAIRAGRLAQSTLTATAGTSCGRKDCLPAQPCAMWPRNETWNDQRGTRTETGTGITITTTKNTAFCMVRGKDCANPFATPGTMRPTCLSASVVRLPIISTVAKPESWPELPFEKWKDTCATLHMWTQIVGKIRLVLTRSEERRVGKECRSRWSPY